ncbi:hypothetical protein Q4503_11140 [Colwellia sp. 6_MG-2023]|uniref:hypothetical protein n=1 Tax=Colwellia sp. 6_MG-2023 TaxID=3062676 RepID=UPI0026E30A4D|nr:hypothetical protein [Colwellia sp. 6_MG-2023]MDO6488259.1 hypothetical protein [Colwellia sp. 6_MG-2023]
MARTNWKCIVPHNMNHAIQLCKQHALDNKNMSVARIADHLAITTDTLYKWLGNGRIPANHVFAYEQACGISFITEYLAHSQGYLLVKAPTGRKAEHKDLNKLQLYMAQVAAKIIEANEGDCTAQDAIDHIKILMQDLAYQQKNVAAVQVPQTQFDLTS